MNNIPTFVLCFDGSTSGGNPGTGGCGAYWYKNDEQQEEFKESRRLGLVTSNAAEYNGLILGLRSILKEYPILKFDLEIFGDSELVIKQVKGEQQVRHPMMRIYHTIVLGLLAQIKGCVEFVHIPRIHNDVADGLAKAATDKKTEREDILMFYPNVCGLHKLRISGNNDLLAGTDLGAAGTTYENLVDATTLMDIFGASPLRSLRDPGRNTILRGKVDMTVLGILPGTLECSLQCKNNEYLHLVLTNVVVVDFLPYDAQISFKNKEVKEAASNQCYPNMFSPHEVERATVRERFKNHPYWNTDTILLPM